MRLPNFTNLNRFISKCMNVRGNINITADEAKKLAYEYKMMQEYIVHLQDQIIQQQSQSVTEVEIEGPEF